MRVFCCFLIVMKICLLIFELKFLLYFFLNKLLNNVIKINYFENLFYLNVFLLDDKQNYQINIAIG